VHAVVLHDLQQDVVGMLQPEVHDDVEFAEVEPDWSVQRTCTRGCAPRRRAVICSMASTTRANRPVRRRKVS
jgi:hypothetical protein